MPKHTVQVAIPNRLGLHARPAMAFVDCACQFASAITVTRVSTPGAAITAQPPPVDGKSIMQMMMLAATKGTVLEVCADGEDAEKAIATLKALVEGGFDEE